MAKRRIRLFEWTKKFSLKKVLILIVVLTICYLIIDKWKLIDDSAQYFLKKHQIYVVYIIPLSIVIGFLHAYMGNAKEHSLYLFKYLGPILSSPLTCLTYGVIINSTFALIYIVCYDSKTILHYTTIDKTTLTYTLILLLSWSIFGIVKIVMDIIKQRPDEKVGEITPVSQTINIHEQWELNSWAEQLNVSPEKIIEAVNNVGNTVEAVKEYFQK